MKKIFNFWRRLCSANKFIINIINTIIIPIIIACSACKLLSSSLQQKQQQLAETRTKTTLNPLHIYIYITYRTCKHKRMQIKSACLLFFTFKFSKKRVAFKIDLTFVKSSKIYRE
jgi:hypothetical protein